jgi:hypothetical protein
MGFDWYLPILDEQWLLQIDLISYVGIEKKKIMGNIRRDLMVPTLDEIRNALQNLKKKETL